jgi:hypothetical protein
VWPDRASATGPAPNPARGWRSGPRSLCTQGGGHCRTRHLRDPPCSYRAGSQRRPSVSPDLVRTLLQENDVRAIQPRAHRVSAVLLEASKPTIGDHVERDFAASVPEPCSWAASPTSKTRRVWLCLVTVTDRHSNVVIDWSIICALTYLNRNHHGRPRRTCPGRHSRPPAVPRIPAPNSLLTSQSGTE